MAAAPLPPGAGGRSGATALHPPGSAQTVQPTFISQRSSLRPGNYLSDGEFQTLSQLIERHLGISMPENKRSMLETRLIRRLRQLKLDHMTAYCRYLESEKGKKNELSAFLDLATTNKTSFFRELPQLGYLDEHIFPKLLERAARTAQPLRIWSAACSTGQEVWTLAFMLERLRTVRCPSAEFQLLGSDISGRTLREAIAAKYGADELGDVAPEFMGYFMQSRDRSLSLVRVRPELRRRAGFFQQNLMAAQYNLPAPVDLIFLRNALIYFPRDRQEQIVGQALRYLNADGYFVVGLTESLHGMKLPIRHVGHSIYQLTGAP